MTLPNVPCLMGPFHCNPSMHPSHICVRVWSFNLTALNLGISFMKASRPGSLATGVPTSVYALTSQFPRPTQLIPLKTGTRAISHYGASWRPGPRFQRGKHKGPCGVLPQVLRGQPAAAGRATRLGLGGECMCCRRRRCRRRRRTASCALRQTGPLDASCCPTCSVLQGKWTMLFSHPSDFTPVGALLPCRCPPVQPPLPHACPACCLFLPGPPPLPISA